MGGSIVTAYGALSGRTIPTDQQFQAGLTAATIVLDCPDPRGFGTDVVAPTPLPMSSGGWSWPISWPITWDETVVSGEVSMTNPGNVTGPLTLRINGPVTAPVITHTSSGNTLEFGSDLVIYAGDYVDVDMEARTVLYNGQVSRNGFVTQRGWFGFDPGVNEIGFNADSYDPSASLVVTGTPAWI
jgi:hypothetical protein